MKAVVGLICLIIGQVCHCDSSSDRIIGGEPAKRGDYPWLVTVLIGGYEVCHGTILDNRTILITANCAAYINKEWVKTNKIQIRVGDHLSKRIDPYEKDVDVKRVIMHPKYKYMEAEYHDVAIMKLRCELMFNDYVQAIPIVSSTWKEKRLIDINDCSFAGFGAITADFYWPWQLQMGKVTVKDRWHCAWRLRNIESRDPFTKYNLCTDEEGLTACFGDTGAGLVCKDGNGNPYLLGQMSGHMNGFFNDCQEGLNVFVRISEFADWIQVFL